MHLFVSVAVLAVAVLLSPAATAGEQYPPQGVQVDEAVLSAEVVERGEAVRLSGSGFLPGVLVMVDVGGDAVRPVRADERGTVRVNVNPTGTGSQLLSASGPTPDGTVRVVSASVRVLPSGDRSLSDGYSRTSDVLPGLLSGLAVVVLVAGLSLLVRVARRPVQPA